MSTTATERPKRLNDTAEGQRKLSEFVDREVIYCVSQLVSELMDGEEYHELDNMYERRCCECGEAVPADTDDNDPCPECEEEATAYEQEPQEVYEWWIVSGYLAERLRDRGCVVCDDFHGLVLWGRCCTGQSIHLDCVIEEIYAAMHADNQDDA